MIIDAFRARLWLAVFALSPAGCPRPPAHLPPADAGVVVPEREMVDGAMCVPRAAALAHATLPYLDDVERACPTVVDPSITVEPGAPDGKLAKRVTKGRRGIGADVCCYDGTPRTVKGRAYVDDGALVAANVASTAGAARRWLDDGALEHASIASFARATLELMAVGAPLAIVRDMQQAALDEVKHAELCLEVARSLGASVSSYGALRALAPRALDLAGLARACLEEACVNETVAAARAHEEAARSSGRVAQVLRIIADDEERHAALAWRTLRWLVEAGGAPVVAALRDVDVNDALSRDILAEIVRHDVAT